MPRMLALLPYPLNRVPGQRFRIEQWAPHLRRSGVEVDFCTFLSPEGMDLVYGPGSAVAKALRVAASYVRRLGAVWRARSYDVVFLYREAALFGGPWLERLLALRVPFVFDFDDSIYLPPPVSLNRRAALFKSRSKTAAICGAATHVTVGNSYLQTYAQKHCGQVSVVPTTIDTDTYTLKPRPENHRLVVGWSGSPTTVCYLSDISSALSQTHREVPFELRLIGAAAEVPGLEVACYPWVATTETEDIRLFDVGLMPLRDDDWCRGKCGLKALQYMALGVAPIVSPVGVNTEIVTDGVNGFVAHTEQEWVQRLLLLLRDSDLRRRMGAAARATVEQRYSCHVHVPRVAAILSRSARATAIRAPSPD